MADLVLQGELGRFWVSLLLIAAVVAQLAAWQILHTRYGWQLVDRGRRRGFEAAVSLFIFVQLVHYGLLLERLGSSLFPPVSQWWRWGGWLALLVATLALGAWRRPGPMLVLGVTALQLPWSDLLPAPLPAIIWQAAMVFLVVRAIVVGYQHRRRMRDSISALSVQEAIDKLPAGLAFVSAENQEIVLINQRMRTVLAMLDDSQRHPAGVMAELLAATPLDQGLQASLGQAPVVELSDGSQWMVQVNDCAVAGKPVHEVVALDVTERWRLVSELAERHDDLEARAWQLQDELERLLEVCTADELIKARTRVHDVIGQRASMLLRMLRSDVAPDRATLAQLASGMQLSLGAEEPTSTPRTRLEILRNALAGIGVRVVGPARLPDDRGIAELVVDIITEAISNAIKHGAATEIVAECSREADSLRLTVSNNGIASPTPITEHGGIGGMRYRLDEVGGTLQVISYPNFAIRATIPAGGQA